MSISVPFIFAASWRGGGGGGGGGGGVTGNGQTRSLNGNKDKKIIY